MLADGAYTLYFTTACFFSVAYVGLFSYFAICWKRASEYIPGEKNINNGNLPSVSIVIAVRNEAESIQTCLSDISVQDFPADRFEVIIVDDHSTDRTGELCRFFIEEHKKRNFMFFVNTQGYGKKTALETGINAAKGELVITTDSDCRMNKTWMKTVAEYYIEYRPKMIISPVLYHKDTGIFQQLQALEFMSLSGTSGAAALAGIPIMCNGANLAFEKGAFLKAGGYSGTNNVASGDDIFLLHKFKNLFPREIHYLKSLSAIVYTLPSPNLKEFFMQRMRWSGKTIHYTDHVTIFVAWFIFFVNFLLVLSVLLSLIQSRFAEILLLQFIGKAAIDYLFLFLTGRFFHPKGGRPLGDKRNDLLFFFLPLSCIYPFYVVFTVTWGNLFRYKWKERVVDNQ